MSFSKQRDRQQTLQIVEEATHLLRSSPASAWALYYVGTAPFVAYLFFFWSDMSRSAVAAQRALESSLVLAVLYMWMKVCQALYCERLMAKIEGEDELPPMKLRGWMRLVASQTCIHATMPWILVLASAAVVPMGWAYAFYHNVTVLAANHFREGGRTKQLLGKSLTQSHYQPLQHHGMLIVLSIVGFLVWVNLFAGFGMLNMLLKAFTGADNEFTRHPMLYISTTCQALLISGSYLVMGPLVKALYVLRCFYGEARKTGADIKVRLHQLQPASTGAMLSMVLLCGLMLTGTAEAKSSDSQFNSAPPSKASAERLKQPVPAGRPHNGTPITVESAELQKKINDVLTDSEFQWRFPREENAPKQESWLGGVIHEMTQWFESAMTGVARFIGKIYDWLFHRDSKDEPDEKKSSSAWLESLQYVLYALIGLIIAFLVVLLYRTWRRRKEDVPLAAEAAPEVNLESEDIVATQLPENEWLKLAREKLDAGELRLALRALFLATLAHLGEKRLIAITRSKSNGDYVRELGWRARGSDELSGSFAEQVRTFDRIWYGWHEVNADTVSRFEQHHEQILAHAS